MTQRNYNQQQYQQYNNYTGCMLLYFPKHR